MNWDLNLAFNTANVGGGPGAIGGAAPQDGVRPDVGERPAGPGLGGPGADGDNVLVSRFMENDAFAQLYAERTAELTDSLFASGIAAEVVATWVDVLGDQASEVVDAATIEADAAAILAALPSA